MDFKKDILPIFKKNCFQCHSVEEGKEKGGVALDFPVEVKRFIGDQEIIVPGSPGESDLLRLVLLNEDHPDAMPPSGKGDPLSAREIAKIRDWIEQGASLETGGAPEVAGAGGKAVPAEITETRQYELWTSADGRELKGAFRSVESGSVELLLESGKVVKVPFAKLSDQSQALAKERYATQQK